MLIIGSCAAYYHGLTDSFPKDIDTFYKESNFKSNIKGEDGHIIPDKIYDLLESNSTEGFISPNDLYTLKCSHLQWDIKWDKTKRDILFYKAQGCRLNENLYNMLVSHWKDVHGDKSFLSLSKDRNEFFQDNVKYIYDHDYLHEVCAEGLGLTEPTYKKCLKDGEDVLIDNSKFDKLSFEDQVSMFRQEIAVIAFERWIVFGKIGWFKAHMISVKKTITNLTKNSSSDFLVKNLEMFVKPDYTYYSNLLKLLEE